MLIFLLYLHDFQMDFPSEIAFLVDRYLVPKSDSMIFPIEMFDGSKIAFTNHMAFDEMTEHSQCFLL